MKKCIAWRKEILFMVAGMIFLALVLITTKAEAVQFTCSLCADGSIPIIDAVNNKCICP